MGPPPDTRSTTSTDSIESCSDVTAARHPTASRGGSSNIREERQPPSGIDTRVRLLLPHVETVGVIASGRPDSPRQADASRLFRQYGNQLLRRALWQTGSIEDAEDLVQETFVRFVKEPPSELVVRDEAAYLRTILGNLVKDFYRHRDRRVRVIREPEDSDFVPQSGWDAEEAYLDEDWRCFIATLPQRQQDVLYLIYGLDLSPAMAAERMEISPKHCYKYHHLALQKLRDHEEERRQD
jgi:RNA polymerase sigma factor (sigma-70 family)